jgi:hypothetical protein
MSLEFSNIYTASVFLLKQLILNIFARTGRGGEGIDERTKIVHYAFSEK